MFRARKAVLFGALGLCLIMTPQAPLHYGEGGCDLSPADQRIFAQMFYVRADEDPPVIGPYSWAMIGEDGNLLKPGTVAYRYFDRASKIATLHYPLREKNAGYRARFEAAEKKIFSLLPPRPNEVEGHQIAFHVFCEAGVLTELVAAAGKDPEVVIPPEEQKYPLWGLPDNSFVAGVGSEPNQASVPDGLIPFHCCQGDIVVSVLGSPYKEYAEAHLRLIEGNPHYRDLYLQTVEPFAREARALARPLGAKEQHACAAITADLRNALQQTGALKFLEDAVSDKRPQPRASLLEGGK